MPSPMLGSRAVGIAAVEWTPSMRTDKTAVNDRQYTTVSVRVEVEP